MSKLILVIIMAIFLTACASQSSPLLMPPLTYHGDDVVHISDNAYLYWERGQDLAGEKFTAQLNGVEGLVAGIIESADRKNNPSKYQMSYGKAQQAAFITNFRDVLMNNHVFKSITIVTSPHDVRGKGTLVTIRFRSTKVSGFEYENKITLTVDLKIQSSNSTFMRTYLAESDVGTFLHGKNFAEQVVDVSETLVSELMHGIKQWART